MNRINPPDEKLYMEFLGKTESDRKDLYEQAGEKHNKIQQKISDESDSITLAKQYQPFRDRLQAIADSFIGKWAFIEPSTEVAFDDKPIKNNHPIIMYGMSMTYHTRFGLTDLGNKKDLVNKDGKIIDISFSDLYSLDSIRLDAVVVMGKDAMTAKVLPGIIYDNFNLSNTGDFAKDINNNLVEFARYNRIYHLISNMSGEDSKAKCAEYLRGKRDAVLEKLKTDRDNIIKGYDYITDYIGTCTFENEEVRKLYGNYT